MSNILQKKLATKIILLFALTAALAYLRMPGRAQAETCAEQCSAQYVACIAACKNNGTCELQCSIEDEGCVKHCIE
jgi:hypothetical protein